MEIGIIGGAGHVGLPTGIVFADAGHSVVLIDKDEDALKCIEAGEMPFSETGGEAMLQSGLDAGNLQTTTDLAAAATCDVLIVVIGTPIDEHHNPEMAPLLEIVDDLEPYLHADHQLILRSTVYPGTTAIVRDRLEASGFTVGDDIYLAFAPERVAQHNALEEIVDLPQLVGAFDEASYVQTEAVFQTVLDAECLRLTPTEAELGKLFTNMWRYLTFAAANEFYLITETFAPHHNVNVNRILEKTGYEYPRFDVPSPGPNVGGPCLTKDGWFLVDNLPFNELVSASFQINEGIPATVIEKMTRKRPDPEKVAILGMTFKPNSDDTRNSVAFKLSKQLKIRGFTDVVRIEPNCEGFDDWADLEGSDWVILMTPHDEFDDLADLASTVDNPECLVSDIWGFWEEVKFESDNGYFTLGEVVEQTEAVPVGDD